MTRFAVFLKCHVKRDRSVDPDHLRLELAQIERKMMLERRREGIRKAQAEGRYLGPKRAAVRAGEAVGMVENGKCVAAISFLERR